MRFAFLGSTSFSKKILEHLISNGYIPQCIFSIPEYFSINYSEEKVRNYNFSDLAPLAKQLNVPFYEIDSKPGHKLNSYSELLNDMQLDVILAIGWYYVVPSVVLELPRHGVWGIHASLLPRYAGGAPLVWAMINGEHESGVTLFRMNKEMDAGEIINQQKFHIGKNDNIQKVYERAIESSKEVLLCSLDNIGDIHYQFQDNSKLEVYPQRSPRDGYIKLSKFTAEQLYDFIRAQSLPYPRAFFIDNRGYQLKVNNASLEASIKEVTDMEFKPEHMSLAPEMINSINNDQVLVYVVAKDGKKVFFNQIEQCESAG